LLPDVEVILLGEETGLAEAARELGVKHIPTWRAMQRHAVDLVHVSTGARKLKQRPALHHQRGHDLMPDFVEAAKKVRSKEGEFVLLSQRWDWTFTLNRSIFRQGTGRIVYVHRPGQGSASPSRRKRFLPLPKILLSDIPNFTSAARAGTIG
jgi:hypothetical protein